jgi:hypothetical protein
MDEPRRFSIESKGKFFDDVMTALNNGEEALLIWSKQIDEDKTEIHQSIIRFKEDCPACDSMAPLYLAVQVILYVINQTNLPSKHIYELLAASLYKNMMADAHADSAHQEVSE